MAIQWDGQLDGQVYIVNGGTGGIGSAVCRSIAEAGGHVVVADVHRERVDKLVAELPRATNSQQVHLGLTLDVRNESDNQDVARQTVETFGRIDGLVACAGILRGSGSSPRPLVEVSLDEWIQVVDTNLKGVFLSNRSVLPTMISQRSGTIINVSSISGLQGRAHDGPYCASKFGVIGLTQAVADEVKRFGVKVLSIMPEAIATPMWDQNGPVPPPGDALPPERVADVIMFLLSQPADTVLLGSIIAPLGARRRKLGGEKKQGEQEASTAQRDVNSRPVDGGGR